MALKWDFTAGKSCRVVTLAAYCMSLTCFPQLKNFSACSLYSVCTCSLYSVCTFYSMFTVQRVYMFTVQRVCMFTVQRVYIL